MCCRHMAPAVLIAALSSSVLHADDLRLKGGLYEVQFRLELPHLENHAIDRTTTICINQSNPDRRQPPVPLFSQNDIFADCEIKNVQKKPKGFSYDIICTGRGSARATATYVTSPERFKSRIAIVQGAKNMTMTEVQHGRRLGGCGPSAPDSP